MKDRRNAIRTYIEEKGEVRLSDLELMFPALSSMTLRRDLIQLEESGYIVRIKGGAKSIAHLSRIKEELYSKRTGENTKEKELIAKAAICYLEQGRSVFLDSGTTGMAFAGLLENQKVFITTSGPNIALEAARNPNATVHIIGGSLNRDNMSLSGINALSFLENINIDIAFLGASGFSFKSGFTCGDYNECEIKRKVLKKANRVIIMMDSSKFGKNMPFTFCRLNEVDVFITDDNLSEEIVHQIEETSSCELCRAAE